MLALGRFLIHQRQIRNDKAAILGPRYHSGMACVSSSRQDSPSHEMCIRCSSKTKIYIVSGDWVTAIDVLGDEWVKIDFQQASGHMLRKWTRASDITQR